jgi:hypothetical protein
VAWCYASDSENNVATLGENILEEPCIVDIRMCEWSQILQNKDYIIVAIYGHKLSVQVGGTFQ